jgi:ribosomal protein S18 acetylase RimI-like enzyme
MSDAEISIRQGTVSDHGFIHELGHATLDANVSPIRPAPYASLADSYDRFLDFVYSVSHRIFIAELDTVRAGFLLLVDQIPDDVTSLPQAFVAYAAVSAEYRRRGIGSKLCGAAEAYARGIGLPHISLVVTRSNANALALYRQLGFLEERIVLTKAL